ncbi:MAG: hypothetical protein HY518_00350 [Candidatus Aenigmarchaeota archaeon]|nr:hypothetical protein [Candidatus Aenigmarchaeota archaeon]
MATQEESSGMMPDFMFYFLLVIIALAVGYFIYLAIFTFQPVIDLQRNARATLEISENLMSSPLTTSKAVFSSAELDKIDNKIVEPYVRHCAYGYKAEIESGGRKWIFGYEPRDFGRYFDSLKEHALKTPVSVDGKPGTLTVTTYENTITSASCLIQRAFVLKKIEKWPCKIPTAGAVSLPRETRAVRCDIKLEKQRDDFLCIGAAVEEAPLVECRHLPGIQVQKFIFKGKKFNEIKDMFLVAYPLKRYADSCENLNPADIAGEKDDVVTVLLCIEEAAKP